MRLVATLILAAIILTAIAWHRPPEYDEAYSIFLTANHPRPLWPTGIFTPANVQPLFSGHASLVQIAHNLRIGDVHPPLYFWALEYFRRLAGPSWFAARLLSVFCATASLALLAAIAREAKIPVIPAILICLLSYSFAYTSIVARGFALAQLLNLTGLALITAPKPSHPHLTAYLAGLALSAASFTNYLAIFPGIGIFCSLLLSKNKTPAKLKITFIGFATLIPADLYFFSAQHASRLGQFTSFYLPHALALLIKNQAAALYGGLPLYAGHFAPAIIAALAILTAIIIGHLIKRPSHFLIIASATPIGLLALGFIFNNTPIEIRYCAFTAPYLALALANALPTITRNILLITQAGAITGLALSPATMQPQGLAAAQANPQTLILIPFGNDGVGIPGPFIEAAAPTQKILIIPSATLPNLKAQTRIALAILPLDNASKALIPILKYKISQTRPLISATPQTLTYGQSQPHQQP